VGFECLLFNAANTAAACVGWQTLCCTFTDKGQLSDWCKVVYGVEDHKIINIEVMD